jgi:hypothetical protein
MCGRKRRNLIQMCSGHFIHPKMSSSNQVLLALSFYQSTFCVILAHMRMDALISMQKQISVAELFFDNAPSGSGGKIAVFFF